MPLSQTLVPSFSGDVEVRSIKQLVQPSFDDSFNIDVHEVEPLETASSWDSAARVTILQVTPVQSQIADQDAVQFLTMKEI